MKKIYTNINKKLHILKLGFTLIELLAVMIILVVIALIATPIVLNIVNDAKDAADLRSVEGIIYAGSLYYKESIIDESKKKDIINLNNIYNIIQIQGYKPNEGFLYANNDGQVAVSVIFHNKCYKKTFSGDIEKSKINENEKCELGYIGNDQNEPNVEFEYYGTIGDNDWYISNAYIKAIIKDNESGINGLKWCSGVNCDPIIDEANDFKMLEFSGQNLDNQLCVIGYDNAMNYTDKICSKSIKIDKNLPILVAVNENLKIAQGSNNLVSHYFNANKNGFSNIKETICQTNSTIISDTSMLVEGNYKISCTILKENGLSATQTNTIDVIGKLASPIIRKTNGTSFGWNAIKNADKYTVYVNDKAVATFNEAQTNLNWYDYNSKNYIYKYNSSGASDEIIAYFAGYYDNNNPAYTHNPDYISGSTIKIVANSNLSDTITSDKSNELRILNRPNFEFSNFNYQEFKEFVTDAFNNPNTNKHIIEKYYPEKTYYDDISDSPLQYNYLFNISSQLDSIYIDKYQIYTPDFIKYRQLIYSIDNKTILYDHHCQYTSIYFRVTSNSELYLDSGPSKIIVQTCLVKNTDIEILDRKKRRKKKKIQNIKVGDKVLSLNPNTLELEETLVTEITIEKSYAKEYDIWFFEDGTILKTAHHHRFYNISRSQFVYLNEWNIGEEIYKLDGSKTNLIKHKVIKEKVRHYTIFTENQNYFANECLSGNRYTNFKKTL